MPSQNLVDPKVFERFYKQVRAQKTGGTYLLTGEEIDKKKALAVAFAKAVNCMGKTFRPDCDCAICRQIENGNHPDVKWYGLDEEAASIKIDEVRDFKNWLAFKSFEAKVKVFIFNGAERLTPDAQNALLKSLEEPPPGNLILLLVPHKRNLFDTISSRAMELKVPPFRTAEVEKILTEEGASSEEARFLARLTQGELARARRAREDGWFGRRREWVTALIKSPTAFLEEFGGLKRNELAEVFDFLVELARDLLVLRVTANGTLLVHANQQDDLGVLLGRHDFDAVSELFQAMNESRRSLDDYANQKLAITHAQMTWERFIKP